MGNKFCKKCGACCKHIIIDKERKIICWDAELPLTEEFEAMLFPADEENNIYACRFLVNNLCTNPNRPEVCINYPSFPFVQLPENCGYEGYIFVQKEKLKHKIRKLKEEILHYTVLSETTNDKRERQQYQKIINTHVRYIDKYKNYGSDNW